MSKDRLLLAAIVGACACSSSPSGPNVDSAKLLVALSASEQNALCDWKAAQYGGYSKAISCGGGVAASQRGPADQSTCVSSLPHQASAPSCPAKVGQFEVCVQWTVTMGCGSALPPPECAALRDPQCM